MFSTFNVNYLTLIPDHMNKKLKSLFLVIGLLLISSCASTDEGRKVADQFFQLIVEEKYEDAADLIEINSGVTVDERVEMAKSLGMHDSYGKLQSAKKVIGFNTSIADGATTVELPYKLHFKNGDYSPTVTVIDRGNGFRVSAVE